MAVTSSRTALVLQQLEASEQPSAAPVNKPMPAPTYGSVQPGMAALPDQAHEPQPVEAVLTALQQVPGYTVAHKFVDGIKMSAALAPVREAAIENFVGLAKHQLAQRHAVAVEQSNDAFQVAMTELATRSHASANRLDANVEAQRFHGEGLIIDQRDQQTKQLLERLEAGLITQQDFVRLAKKARDRAMAMEARNDAMADETSQAVRQRTRRLPGKPPSVQ